MEISYIHICIDIFMRGLLVLDGRKPPKASSQPVLSNYSSLSVCRRPSCDVVALPIMFEQGEGAGICVSCFENFHLHRSQLVELKVHKLIGYQRQFLIISIWSEISYKYHINICIHMHIYKDVHMNVLYINILHIFLILYIHRDIHIYIYIL